jgi:hypothetical protein
VYDGVMCCSDCKNSEGAVDSASTCEGSKKMLAAHNILNVSFLLRNISKLFISISTEA